MAHAHCSIGSELMVVFELLDLSSVILTWPDMETFFLASAQIYTIIRHFPFLFPCVPLDRGYSFTFFFDIDKTTIIFGVNCDISINREENLS